jgi:hypothetical protein
MNHWEMLASIVSTVGALLAIASLVLASRRTRSREQATHRRHQPQARSGMKAHVKHRIGAVAVGSNVQGNAVNGREPKADVPQSPPNAVAEGPRAAKKAVPWPSEEKTRLN